MPSSLRLRVDVTSNELSLRRYRKHAARYDASARRTMPLRLRAIALLALRAGDIVLDVGAGTGLSFAPLLDRVGPLGRVLAVEQSPDMAALARERIARHRWDRVLLAQIAAERVVLPCAPDAVLFNYVHDITRCRTAVDNVLSQCKPGARIVVAGVKYFPWWTGPLNLLPWLKNRPYNVHPGELWQPWDLIERWCEAFERRTTQAGMGYIATGVRRRHPP